ncbi:MFS transporter [Agromyces indicus]|uniref:MFS transporter n=1 Tax=Agromyces indicus TaxID=758919 RepID=A0ABU1FFG7_9MICO|nr:MFS transporter [Agromyces indicus]MDR5690488.1 MFS transporter [Agromyces indicus]
MPATDLAGLARAIGADEAVRRRVQRRTLAVVVASQVLGGAGLAAGITVGALLARDLLGSDSLTGAPAALFTLGSALAAFLVGRVTQRWGRRTGLGLGFAAGGAGAIGVVAAAVSGNVPLLFASLFVYGAGTATNLQARYAGTDLALPTQRGTAVSVAMVSTTLGAVAGPNLVEPLGALALSLGIPPLAGPFLLAAAAYLGAGSVLFLLLRPDPFLVAQHLDHAPGLPPAVAPEVPSPAEPAQHAEPAQPAASQQEPSALARGDRFPPGVVLGATIMILTQATMVAIMTMTPVHMRGHDHALSAVGLVIGIHIGAMYLPSLVTGVLVDRIGRIPMAVAAAVTMLLAGGVAALAPSDSLGLLIVALTLLGLGWNFGLISGTALVVDATSPSHRAKTQGSIDVLIALSGAGASALSGLVLAATDYATLSVVGGLLSLLLVPVVIWARRAALRRRR